MAGSMRNGVDVDRLMTAVESVKKDAANGKLTFTVKTDWKGEFKARHTTSGYVVGREQGHHQRDYAVETDEPKEILGGDSGISQRRR